MTDLVPFSSLEIAGQVANEIARQNVLHDYLLRKSPQTIRSLANALQVFEHYLQEAGVHSSGIALDLVNWQEADLSLDAWGHVTHGLVRGFLRWQLAAGYALGSLGVHLSAVKTLCKLAAASGFLPPAELGLIQLISGYKHKERRNVDRQREVTRIGEKKAQALVLSPEQVTRLKNQPDTPQGWRDRVLVCLFFDHGLRCGELAQLTRENIDFSTGKLTFYREKVSKEQIHVLTSDTLLSLMNYLSYVELQPQEPLLRGSQKGKGGTRLGGRMSKRAITARLHVLGKRTGIESLSAHDGRHTWATAAERAGTSITDLAQAGGWASIALPYSRYVKAKQVANSGVKLDH